MSDLISERGQALILAATVLDRINADPDDDLAVLARQLSRCAEENDRLRHENHELKRTRSEAEAEARVAGYREGAVGVVAQLRALNITVNTEPTVIRAGEPDWPLRMSAIGLPDGYLQRGSTGQTTLEKWRHLYTELGKRQAEIERLRAAIYKAGVMLSQGMSKMAVENYLLDTYNGVTTPAD